MSIQLTEEIQETTKFNSQWTIYESYAAHHDTTNWNDLTKKVCNFINVKEFVDIWTYLPHGRPSNLFQKLSNGKTERIKTLFQIQSKDNQFEQIDGVSLFRNDIFPDWDDKRNSDGGIYQYQLQNLEPEQFDLLWMHLSSALVGENIPHSMEINGIKIIDKIANNIVRIEIWVKSDKFVSPEIEQLHREIVTAVESILTELNIRFQNKLQYKAHKTDVKYHNKK